MPAKTATSAHGQIQRERLADELGRQQRRAATGLTVMVVATRVGAVRWSAMTQRMNGEAPRRTHRDRGRRSMARCAEAGHDREASSQHSDENERYAPAPMPTARKPSALER